jgi:hypothetical protein
MRDSSITITIEVKQLDGTWKQSYIDFLEPGDVIRRRNPDGNLELYPIGNTEGKTEMVVTELPFLRIEDPCSPGIATT